VFFAPFIIFLPAPDLSRFPSREEVVAARLFNRAYLAHLQAQRSLDAAHWWDYHDAIAETNALYAAWDCLDDAQLARDPLAQWCHLQRLRDLLGEPAFVLGRMPPPAPFHRFVDLTP
jgi:hypothetical protein